VLCVFVLTALSNATLLAEGRGGGGGGGSKGRKDGREAEGEERGEGRGEAGEREDGDGS